MLGFYRASELILCSKSDRLRGRITLPTLANFIAICKNIGGRTNGDSVGRGGQFRSALDAWMRNTVTYASIRI